MKSSKYYFKNFSPWEITLVDSPEMTIDMIDAYIKAKKIIVSDCDGILTDGGHYYSETGKMYKRFGSCDKEAMKFMIKCGWIFLFVTDDPTGLEITNRRMYDWDVSGTFWFSRIVKLFDEGNEQLSRAFFIRSDVSPKERAEMIDGLKAKGVYTVFLGDSMSDLLAASKADMFCTVDNAIDKVKENASIVSKKMGGFCGFADLMYKIHDKASRIIVYNQSNQISNYQESTQ